MAEAPLGIPTAPDCVDAARDTAALLEQLGHEVTEVEVPTISARAGPRLHDDGRRRPRRL
jgi:Asp-tRNA(Asn)/Glu-tRNA(Gln) amidotransferase A subunit family amidase